MVSLNVSNRFLDMLIAKSGFNTLVNQKTIPVISTYGFNYKQKNFDRKFENYFKVGIYFTFLAS